MLEHGYFRNYCGSFGRVIEILVRAGLAGPVRRARCGWASMMQYNARKQEVVRESYHRAFVAAGLLDE
jgi:hypothetical protein